ncbi:fimbrial protein [Stenotrophomonas sp. MH181796]|uniref:fimbrial protein n=1 Tax=Stenotrophomonas sp. MH181796 TaxID=2339228 RepID=UPI00129C7750|nr:fimbrial protein [Stenotrophomonas sp. MH181796]
MSSSVCVKRLVDNFMNKLGCLVAIIFLRKGFFLLLGVCIGAFSSFEVIAQTILCSAVGDEHRQMPLQVGTLSVRGDVPLGSIVYRQKFERQAGSTLSCTGQAGRVLDPATRRPIRVYPEFSAKYTFEYNSTPLSLSGWNQGVFAGKVYNTGVPGLGVAFIRGNQPGAIPSSSRIVFPETLVGHQQCPDSHVGALSATSCTLQFASNLSFDLLLIKIGNVAPGVIAASSLPTPVMRVQVGTADPVSIVVPITGSISMLSSTCSTPDINVEMGSHSIGELAAARASAWKGFEIRLLGCPGFMGSFTAEGPIWMAPSSIPADNRLGLRNTQTPGRFTRAGTMPNTLSYRIDPTVAPIDAENGVLSLDPALGGSPAPATGIAVQISDSSGRPLPLGEAHSSGLNLQSSPQDYSIPLRARYVRGEGALAPGPAVSSATFTIIYH